ncbi:MAG: hypothetical protein NVV72_10775 [Asticcacaulis sp.]|nr:hypothetical protein [Asticcacaulis sp.]
MNRNLAFPFLVIPDDAVTISGWLVGNPGSPLSPAPDYLQDWDYARDLELSAGISVDMEAAAAALELPVSKLKLGLVFSTGTGAGGLPKRVERQQTIILSKEFPVASLSAHLSGNALSGRLFLDVQIVLEAPEHGGTALSPTLRGARLWRSEKEILIENANDARFPVEIVSFRENFHGQPQQHAPWYVWWRPHDFHADFGGNVRLYLNADVPDVPARFADGDDILVQTVMADVMSQMISGATELDECDDVLISCESGSVGQQVRAWIDIAFPGQSASVLRSMKQHFPGRFHAAILAAAETGDDE